MNSHPSNRKSIRLSGYDYSGFGGYFVTLCVEDRLCLFGEIDCVGADPRVCPDRTTSGADAGGHAGPPLRMGLEGRDPVEMKLSPAGEMVQRWWKKVPEKFPGIELDVFVVMPNHVHFILINTSGIAKGVHSDCVGADPRVCQNGGDADAGGHVGPPLQRVELGTIIQWFKTMTTNEYIRGVKELSWPRFDGKLWQRNYWERIVRDNEWDSVRSYIYSNPINWAADKLNPENTV